MSAEYQFDQADGPEAEALDERHAFVQEVRRNFAGCIVAPDPDVVIEELIDMVGEHYLPKQRCHIKGMKLELGGPDKATTTLPVERHLKTIFHLLWRSRNIVQRYAAYRALTGLWPWLGDIYGGMGPTEFARWVADTENPGREYGRHTKQNVVKELQRAIEFLRAGGLSVPLPPNSRSAASKEKMRQAALKRNGHVKAESGKRKRDTNGTN